MAKPGKAKAKAPKRAAQIPHWLRPKLTRDQLVDLGIVHASNVDEIHGGKATQQTLWDLVMCVLSWSRVAELRKVGMPEIEPQLHLVAALVQRYGRTGDVRFEGDEYELATEGIAVMDALAQMVDAETAREAVEWATRKTDRWNAAMKEAQRAVGVEGYRGLKPHMGALCGAALEAAR